MRKGLIFLALTLLPVKALGSTLYSVQLYTAKRCKYAERFLSKLPKKLKAHAFIYRTDKGFCTVRLWPSPSIKELRRKLELLKSYGFRNVSIVKTDSKKLKKKTNRNSAVKESKEDKLLLLLYQTYLANSKLKKALEVALRGTEIHPEDFRWWERVAQVSRWLGEEKLLLKSLKELVFRFKKTKYLKELYTVSLAEQDFKTAEKTVEFSETLKEKVFSPQEVMLLLYATKNPQNYIDKVLPLIENSQQAMRELVYIYWAQGQPEKAKEVLNEIKRKFGFKPQDYLMLAHILFSEKKFTEALKTLKEAYRQKIENPELIGTLSDLAWALGDVETAVRASEELIKEGKGRPDDYMRLVDFFYYLNPKKAFEYALKGWKRFKTDSLLLPLLDLSVTTGHQEEFLKTFKNLSEKKRRELLKNPAVLSLYVSVLSKTGEKRRAQELLESYLKRKPNKDLISQYIYLLIGSNETEKLKEVLKKFKTYRRKAPFAFISAYLYLQNGKEAEKILRNVKLSKNDFNKLLTEADVLELMGKENEAYRIRRQVLFRVKQEIEKGNLSEDYVEAYLRALMYFSNQPQFEKEFQRYKRFLTKQTGEDIYYSYLLAKGRFEKLLFREGEKRLKAWMKLSLSLLKEDLYSLRKLTKYYLEELPIRDRVTALEEIEKPGKAFLIAFKGLNDNPYDNKLYRQFRDLTVNYASHYYVSLSYRKVGAPYFLTLSQELLLKLENSLYSGISTRSNFLTRKGGTFSENSLYSQWINLYVKKLFKNSQLKIGISNFSVKGKSEIGFSASETVRGPHQSSFTLEAYKGAPTEISEQAIISCWKEGFKLTFTVPYNNRIGLYTSVEKNGYFSADGSKIGNRTTIYGELSFKLRTGYPDYTLRTYVQRGIFNERKHKNTFTDRISKFKPSDILPENYYQIGAGFNFGSENRFSFVRVWRPFFSSEINYSNTYGWGSSVTGGVGGSLFGKDSLRIEVQFFKGFKGKGTNGFTVESGYRKWF